MLETIEELEKEIDEFQNNIAASGEMVLALKQMIEQIKQQNSEFDMQSKALLSRLDILPANIENTTIANNERIRSDVASELNKSLQAFSDEQGKYIISLQGVQKTIQEFSDLAREQGKSFREQTNEMNENMNAALSDLNEKIQNTTNLLKQDIDVSVSERNKEVIVAQEKYIKEIDSVNVSMKKCGEALDSKYKDFLSVLEKMNISNIYEQNIQLKEEFRKKTTILMVISAVSILIGVVGLFI
jgi:CII-binding regulator of phage lambda lysogenization HflD